MSQPKPCDEAKFIDTEDDDGNQGGRQSEMHRPNAAERGVREHGADLIWIDRGAPVVGH